jgi:DNA-binding NarL/FixJ family response regulator
MLNEEELGKLKKEQNRKILVKEHEYKYEKDKTLKVHFSEAITKKERNLVMIEAIEDGYKQVEIARYLGISSSTVSKILLEDRSKSGNS